MNRRNARAAAPMVYAIAVVIGFFIGGGVGAIVAVVGAMLLGLFYVLSRPDVPEDYDRDVAREARKERRAAR